MAVRFSFVAPPFPRDGSDEGHDLSVVARCESDALPGWVIGFTATQDSRGRFFIKNLQLDPSNGSTLDPARHAISTQLLRRVPLAEALDALIDLVLDPEALRAQLARQPVTPPHDPVAWHRDSARVAEAHSPEVVHRGRKPDRTDAYLAWLAEHAIRAQRQGLPTNRALVNLTGRRSSQVRDDIHTARAKGWLAPTKQGERNFQPGPLLIHRRQNDPLWQERTLANREPPR